MDRRWRARGREEIPRRSNRMDEGRARRNASARKWKSASRNSMRPFSNRTVTKKNRSERKGRTRNAGRHGAGIQHRRRDEQRSLTTGLQLDHGQKRSERKRDAPGESPFGRSQTLFPRPEGFGFQRDRPTSPFSTRHTLAADTHPAGNGRETPPSAASPTPPARSRAAAGRCARSPGHSGPA